MKVNKELILEITKGGILFYLKFIEGLEVEGDKCKNVLNPFYDDKKPSLSIYLKDGHWLFKDHGDSEFSGDVFQYAATHYDLDIQKDFPEILKRMYEIDYSEISYKSEQKLTESKEYKHKSFILDRRKRDKFMLHELEYFKQYGITEEVLREYNVIPVRSVDAMNGQGKPYCIEREKKNQILVAYQYEGGAKIYSPDPKKFWHVGNKPSNYLFGEDLIEEQDDNKIFIVGGEKDVLTMASLGYRAICLNSETSNKIPRSTLKHFSELGFKFVLLYDNDATGIKQSKILSEKYSIPEIKMPSKILDRGGKDISDYVKNGLTKKLFDKIVAKSLKEWREDAEEEGGEKSDLMNTTSETELIPMDVFSKLPPFFRKCCNVIDDPQDKNVVLLSTLALLGGAYRNITGRYHHDRVGTNLYLFVVAPASSGKGIMKFPKHLGSQIHRSLKASLVSSSNGEDKVMELFFIPANSSSSSILAQLANNKGYGMIWENEADTLSDTLSKEWGNFSDCLRKAFHHEFIGYQRRTNNEHVEIETPNLGLVLSGTPNQVNTLIHSAENGLFSRIMFFDFKAKNKWNSELHLAHKNYDLASHFKSLGEEVFEFFEKLIELENDIDFSYTDEQWKQFHEHFDMWFNSALGLFGEEILASIKRLALITFKCSMILSASRLVDSDELPTTLVCNDDDFETSIKIASCCKSHMISVYSRLNKMDLSSRLSNLQQVSYFEMLPEQFTKGISRKVADDLELKHKTSENYLEIYIEKQMLVRYAHGKYRKLI